MTTLRRRLSFCVVLTSLTFFAHGSPAFAYCRTASCPGQDIGMVCSPASSQDCGVPLFWPNGCAGYSVQEAGSNQVPIKTFESLVARAFAAWTEARCAKGSVGLAISNLGRVSCNQPEYLPTGANANVIMFRDDEWSYPVVPSRMALALTTVTFNLDTGEIRDADMELNSAQIKFSTSDSEISTDLLSVITHEAGHFLGLSHSEDSNSTMTLVYPEQSLALRDLAPDDVAGICAVYPARDVSSCDPTPRGGLGDECGSPPEAPAEEGCSYAIRATGKTWPIGLGAVLAGVAAHRASRTRRRLRMLTKLSSRHME